MNIITVGIDIPGRPGVFRMEGYSLNLFRPHRDPMIMIEDVLECDMNEKSMIGVKTVRLEEPFVGAHFPGDPSMPPAFVVEAMAQTAGCLMNAVFYHEHGVTLSQTDIDTFFDLEQPPFNVLAEAKIKHFDLVRPGETIAMYVKIALQRKEIFAFHAEAKVGERLIAKGELILAYPPYMPSGLKPKGNEPTNAAG